MLQYGNPQLILFSGQGDYEDPEYTRLLSKILSNKKIRHRCDLWGYDVNHDWPWWRQAFPYYLSQLVGE